MKEINIFEMTQKELEAFNEEYEKLIENATNMIPLNTPIFEGFNEDEFNAIRYRFNNNYGASVIRTWMSYGYQEGLYELAVSNYHKGYYEIDYTTPITKDVIGYLTKEEVTEILIKISKL